MSRSLLTLISASLLVSCSEVANNSNCREDTTTLKPAAVKDTTQVLTKAVGDVNGDGKPDSVFVMSPIDSTELDFSFYFLDTTIPRIEHVSYCAEIEDIFPVADIDEDGKKEIGLLQTSCMGRMQSITVLTLRGGDWKSIGACAFDMNQEIPPKEQRIIKTGKSTFKMLEIYYDAVEDSLMSKWKNYTMLK